MVKWRAVYLHVRDTLSLTLRLKGPGWPARTGLGVPLESAKRPSPFVSHTSHIDNPCCLTWLHAHSFTCTNITNKSWVQDNK